MPAFVWTRWPGLAMSTGLAAATLWSGLAVPVAADAYRLIAGDALSLQYAAEDLPVALPVDNDGEVRLPGLGGVGVAGLTLDEAEEALARALNDTGLFVRPDVALSITAYAPIVVAGDVTSPGQIAYVPGITVTAALALAGGSSAAGVSRLDIGRLTNDAEATRATLNLEIAATAARIARLEAAVSGQDTIVPNDIWALPVPEPLRLDLEALAEGERQVLAADRARIAGLLSALEQEIQTIETQQELFLERIAVQGEIVENAAEQLARAEELRERGLQTANSFDTAERRDADARARVLELESARVAAAQALATAERQKTQLLGTSRSEDLSALADARVGMAAAELRYGRTIELLALLGESPSGGLIGQELLNIGFDIIRGRPNRPSGQVGDRTPLLPGDTLIVTVTPGGAAPAAGLALQ